MIVARGGYALSFAGSQGADDQEGDTVRGAGPVGAARFAADDGARARTAVLVDERPGQDVDRFFTTMLIDTGQGETRVPLHDRHVEIVLDAQDLAAAGRGLLFPLDVVCVGVAHAGSGSRFRRRHRVALSQMVQVTRMVS
jgi:hypothetical protein